MVSVDLQRQKGFEDALKSLADDFLGRRIFCPACLFDSADYREIDRLLTGYLPPEERLELFTAGVWGKRNSGSLKRPLETELSFFGSRYFLWLQERFGEECEKMLRKEIPRLYAAREEYERSHMTVLWGIICWKKKHGRGGFISFPGRRMP